MAWLVWPSPGNRAVLRLVVLRAVMGSITLALFYSSLMSLPLKDAVTLFFASPVISAIIEWVAIPGDPPSMAVVIGCMITVVGVWMVSSQPDALHSSR